MKTNAEGVKLLKRWEGLRLASYLCPAGVWTIGYGHTGPSVKEGQKITEHQADVILGLDLQKFEDGVTAFVRVPVTANQFSAMVLLAYNIGLAAFGKSTLLRKLNAREAGVADEFPRWNKAGGKVLNGLTARRLSERALFLKRSSYSEYPCSLSSLPPYCLLRPLK